VVVTGMKDTTALISVFDKEGIIEFAQHLSRLNIKIISSGGTATLLRENQINIKEVSEVTGFPEMLDGRVKTLHPIVHAGILARRNQSVHTDTLKKHHIDPIDIVVCNLYPFEQTIEKPKVGMDEVIENIDIGGPTLIRAAAKNYTDVIVITNPRQYHNVIEHLQNSETIDLELRKRLAVEAYTHTAQYDALIAQYLRSQWTQDILIDNPTVTMRKIQDMRYGENPHLKAAFYKALPPIHEPSIVNGTQLHGKELSYNNILDADCTIECIKEFADPTCVIVKHATPCGIASASTLLQAWKDAFSTDEYSPYGGIVAFNGEVPVEVADELADFFLEVVIAPRFHPDAVQKFTKKKNLRLVELPGLDKPLERTGILYRSVVGGYLAQQRDTWLSNPSTWKFVTTRKPSADEIRTMQFAVKCVRHVKSNSVLFAKQTQTVAIGGGQTSRVDAAWIATHKGKEQIRDSVLASDAFFPFRDAVDVAAKAGVKAIVQPGGSIRDDEVIAAANEHHIAMAFTGQRYFRH